MQPREYTPLLHLNDFKVSHENYCDDLWLLYNNSSLPSQLGYLDMTKLIQLNGDWNNKIENDFRILKFSNFEGKYNEIRHQAFIDYRIQLNDEMESTKIFFKTIEKSRMPHLPEGMNDINCVTTFAGNTLFCETLACMAYDQSRSASCSGIYYCLGVTGTVASAAMALVTVAGTGILLFKAVAMHSSDKNMQELEKKLNDIKDITIEKPVNKIML